MLKCSSGEVRISAWADGNLKVSICYLLNKEISDLPIAVSQGAGR